ncbi:hypothetical protein GCM10025865_20420 [Paraoerskovia sediminicola]|uniref:Glycosyltransferase subfamily 4-like N-terminal domain-containing protein n=1 Tax=Paraoerskovia sediminicola TaxID=1138587 RepID=A0ABM8G3W8_9CELL|nr:glycosyltransferase [Paraoerskovia sediminicola]BDZ42743.1 hypothetical protein GCM10025865_20420 [Paraoerskovia sediminicola]
MRIISVVTLFTPDGAYGGPTRVAVNQARELIARGHDVRLVGGCSGFDVVPSQVDGVPVTLFPVRRAVPRTGFAGLVAPQMLRWLRTATDGADLVHVHAARDLVTLPAALMALRKNVPYVLQTHGMIDASERRSAALLDAIWTRRLLRGAGAVLHLTERERSDLLDVVGGPEIQLVEVLNGVPLPASAPPRSRRTSCISPAFRHANVRRSSHGWPSRSPGATPT